MFSQINLEDCNQKYCYGEQPPYLGKRPGTQAKLPLEKITNSPFQRSRGAKDEERKGTSLLAEAMRVWGR